MTTKVTYNGFNLTKGQTVVFSNFPNYGGEWVITGHTPNKDGSYTLNMVQSKRKRKGIKMKHTLVVVASLAVLVGGGALAVHQYDHVHHVQLVQEAKARTAAFVAAEKQAAQAKAAQVQLNALKAQCASDHAKYVAETPAQRAAKTSVTDCNPSLVVSQ